MILDIGDHHSQKAPRITGSKIKVQGEKLGDEI